MRLKTTMDYAFEILRKHKAILEANLKHHPSVIMNTNMFPVYRRQLREIKKAIECLELAEIKQYKKYDSTGGL